MKTPARMRNSASVLCVVAFVAFLQGVWSYGSCSFKPIRLTAAPFVQGGRSKAPSHFDCKRDQLSALKVSKNMDDDTASAASKKQQQQQQPPSRRHKYLDPKNPVDGRPGVRRSTNSKFAGKAKGKTVTYSSSNRAAGAASVSYSSQRSGKYDNIEGATTATTAISAGGDKGSGGRAQQQQYQQRTERLYDSLAAVSNESQMLQKLAVRVSRATLDFDQGERVALAAALRMYVPHMSAHQTALLLTYLGTFTSSGCNWRLADGSSSGSSTGSTTSGGDEVGAAGAAAAGQVPPNQVGLIKGRLLQVSARLSAPDLAACAVGLARMNLDWAKTLPSNSSFTQRLTALLEGSTDSSSISSSSGSGNNSSKNNNKVEPSGAASAWGRAGGGEVNNNNNKLLSGSDLGDTIWAMGTMNARLQQLPPRTRSALLGAFERNGASFSGFSLSSALWALGKAGMRWNSLSVATRTQLARRLAELAPKMSPQQSSKVLWALGTSGARFTAVDGVSKGVLFVMLTNVASNKRSKTGSAVGESQTLIGVAKLGVQWAQLDKPTRQLILELLSRVCKGSGSSRGVTNSLWAMGTIGATAHADGTSSSSGGGTTDSSNSNTAQSSDDSTAPTTPASISISTSTSSSSLLVLPEAVRSLILTSAVRVAEDVTLTAWAMCNLVWGLSKMKIEWHHMEPALQALIMDNISRVEKDMNSVDVCILLWSLGAMGCPLDATPAHFTNTLLRSLDRNLDTIEAEELSKAIWGLSSCCVSWEQLPDTVRWKLNVALRRVGDDMSPQGVANCAYGMTMMCFDFDRPAEAAFRGVHETLLSIVIRNRDGISARRDGMDAYRLVKKEAASQQKQNKQKQQKQQQHQQLRNSRSSSERVDSREAMAGKSSSSSSSSSSVDGSSLPLSSSSQEEEDVVASVDMDIDIISNMPVYVQDIDTVKILRLTKEDEARLSDQERQQQQEFEQLRIFAHYLDVMRFVSDVRRVPKELLESSALERDYGKGSRLQNRVLKGLEKGFAGMTMIDGSEVSVTTTVDGLKGITSSTELVDALFGPNPNRFGISLEASSFEGVFPIDAAVVQGQRDVVALIEVNGPTHYRNDGRLKRKDELKETMYMKRHPDATFHRIRYNEANKLGSDYIGEEVAAAVLSSVKDQSPIGKMLRRSQQSIADFFSWGLRNDKETDPRMPDGRG